LIRRWPFLVNEIDMILLHSIRGSAAGGSEIVIKMLRSHPENRDLKDCRDTVLVAGAMRF